MFEKALRELVHRTGAELAIFCDYDGEAIAFASAGADDFDVRIAGAQLGPAVFWIQKLAKAHGSGERVSVSCATDRQTLLLEGLPGRYYLLLSITESPRVPFARYHLRQVAETFLPEL